VGAPTTTAAVQSTVQKSRHRLFRTLGTAGSTRIIAAVIFYGLADHSVQEVIDSTPAARRLRRRSSRCSRMSLVG